MHTPKYKLLSTNFKSFFNNLDILAMLTDKELTAWTGSRLRTSELLNKTGLKFFESNNIKLNDFSTVFINPRRHESFIHKDNKGINSCRINYIIHGAGKMIWYKLGDSTEKMIWYKLGDSTEKIVPIAGLVDYYVKYNDIEDKEIIDVWDGKKGECALTHITSPHNIITDQSTRVVLSIRLDEPFSKLYDILE